MKWIFIYLEILAIVALAAEGFYAIHESWIISVAAFALIPVPAAMAIDLWRG